MYARMRVAVRVTVRDRVRDRDRMTVTKNAPITRTLEFSAYFHINSIRRTIVANDFTTGSAMVLSQRFLQRE